MIRTLVLGLALASSPRALAGGTVVDPGGVCEVGAKTIYFDLGNDHFRAAPDLRRMAAARVGGNLASGAWTTGCFDKQGQFQPEPVKEGESVRLVLLNARPDLDYTLLIASGALQPSEKLSLTRLAESGPVCGPDGADCDVDAAELDGILRELKAEAALLQKTVDRRTFAPAIDVAGNAAACASSRGRTCAGLDPSSVPTAIPDWWAEFVAEQRDFRGTHARFVARRDVLCRKWASRIADFQPQYPPPVVRAIADRVQRWSEETTRDLTSYTGVRKALALVTQRPQALHEALDFTVAVGTTAVSGVTAFAEIQSNEYYRSNGSTFCAGLPEADPAFAESTYRSSNRAISDALFRYREATALLDHAYSARVFGLRPAEGNTDVVVTVYASSAQKASTATTGAAPAATAGSARTEEKGGENVPVPYQFRFPVEGYRRLSFTFGTAAAFFQRAGAGKDTVSPELKPLVFLDWALFETRTRVIQRFGLQVGVSLEDARRIVSGNNPGKVDVFAGAVVWPLKTIALSAGLVDDFSHPSAVQLGFYVGASADLLAVVDAWKGPKTVLAQ